MKLNHRNIAKTNEKLESLEVKMSGETVRLKNLNNSLEEVGKFIQSNESDMHSQKLELLENMMKKNIELLRAYMFQQKAKKLQELVTMPSLSDSTIFFLSDIKPV